MRYGFIKVCAVTLEVRVADCEYNAKKIIEATDFAAKRGAKTAVFPELCVTGYTCGELFLQDALINAAEDAVAKITQATAALDILCIVGAPVEFKQKIYDCAVMIYRGKILAIVPKKNIPNYSEFYEARYFAPWNEENTVITYCKNEAVFGTNVIIRDKNIKNFALAAEICEDVWTVNPPSNTQAISGATVIANLSASNEYAGKANVRKNLVSGQSAKLVCGYIYASAGTGESTSDAVYSGDNMICENGTVLARGKLFENDVVFAEIDLDMIAQERKKISTFVTGEKNDCAVPETEFNFTDARPERKFSTMPFAPKKGEENEYFEEILKIQSHGLAKRFVHTCAKKAVIGISGGLDSTLALLVTTRAFDISGLDRKNILCVTMPCFGTTSRTYNNAVALTNAVGAELSEVNIKKSVLQHFTDIGHDENVLDVTYENSQARERTQVLMDIANQNGGLVIGTGDMSELALGWATYNGDHMSMYGVNAGVPKTLVRLLVGYCAENSDEKTAEVLHDILDTPVSPELLPPENGQIAQKTEHFVGPYVLHDFFLYYMVRFGFSPSKILFLAENAFANEYPRDEILKWMKVFYRRFFTQQFKRSCIPDGPKAVIISLSPRGDWRMPSDASGNVWLKELENL